MKDKKYSADIIIIGSGLAGLTAGLVLQNASKNVLILEKRKVAGGLCGTQFIDGHEFVIGCNVFGGLVEKEMHKLGVSVQFRKTSTLFMRDTKKINIPPKGKELIKFLPCLWGLTKAAFYMKKNMNKIAYLSLEEFTNNYVKNEEVRELIKSLGYFYGMSVGDLPLKTIFSDFSNEYNYGLNKSIIPIGGPSFFVKKMVERFKQLGGIIHFNTECNKISHYNNGKVIDTNQGKYIAKEIITSQGRLDEYPRHFKKGYSVGAILLAVNQNLIYPTNVHTMLYLPKDISKWMAALDTGNLPKDLGWIIFKNDLERKLDYYTINIYFYAPRDHDKLTVVQKEFIESFILEKAEYMLPGLRKSIFYKKFLTPNAFKELNEISNQPVSLIMPWDYKKPENYDPKSDIYYVGNSVLPHGEHATGAVLSGIIVAKKLLNKMCCNMTDLLGEKYGNANC